MDTNDLIGRRVRVVAWYDHARLIAAYRKPSQPEGTITQVHDYGGEPAVSVRMDVLGETYTLPLSDVEVLRPRREGPA